LFFALIDFILWVGPGILSGNGTDQINQVIKCFAPGVLKCFAGSISSQELFGLANPAAAIGWSWLLLWLFLSGNLQQRTLGVGLLMPLLQAVLYSALMLVYFANSKGGFGSLADVMTMFTDPGVALAGWAHYLSFDLFVGWYISKHSAAHGINPLLIIPCLVLTFLLGLLPVLILASVIDSRLVLDINIWVKPVKFAIALAIFTMTLSFYANYLPRQWRTSRWFHVYVSVVVFTVVSEMIWLVYAAAIGEPSHFNQTHPILMPIYFLMGFFAIVLTSLSLVIGIGVLRNSERTLHPLLRYSVGYGLIVTFILTMITAGYMSSAPAQSHAVMSAGQAIVDERYAVPLIGWLRGAGDLRVAHFFATHALHAVPLFCWLLVCLLPKRITSKSNTARTTALMVSGGYCVLVLATFVQALFGQAFVN